MVDRRPAGPAATLARSACGAWRRAPHPRRVCSPEFLRSARRKRAVQNDGDKCDRGSPETSAPVGGGEETVD